MKQILIGTSVFFALTSIVLVCILLFTGTGMVKNKKDSRITVKYLFQTIANSAHTNYNPKTTIRQLSRLTNNRIVYHRAYKIE